jgi:hypothetical protein
MASLPVLLDLLAVATSAGLPPQLAVRRAVDAADGPLAEELASVLRATDLGGRWRDELVAASRRLGLPDLDRTVGALTRSEALVSSLAEEVGRLAADVREARRASATERARAAPVKTLFPLVFLVLPAFLLLTVVPVLVATVESRTAHCSNYRGPGICHLRPGHHLGRWDSLAPRSLKPVSMQARSSPAPVAKPRATWARGLQDRCPPAYLGPLRRNGPRLRLLIGNPLAAGGSGGGAVGQPGREPLN